MSQFDTDTRGEDPSIEAGPNSPNFDGLAESIQKGLFSDAKNSILTLLFGSALAYTIYKSFFFLFANQKITPDGDVVSAWRVIDLNLTSFMVGSQFGDTGIGFPLLWAAIFLAVFTLGFASGPADPEKVPPMTKRTKISIIGPAMLGLLVLLGLADTWTPRLLGVLVPVIGTAGFYLPRVLPEAVLNRKMAILSVLGLGVFLLETGFEPGNVSQFGGLMLTINAAFISIVACFPIGVMMALARRSSFPLIRPIAVAYIELIRGVPLISLLFMGQFALSFFFPPDFEPIPDVIRAIIMMTLFSAAYVAEIVRGGLQSVAGGQTEAGQAVGLSPITITRRIVLPQALRNSIPALVGQFIALLKDTTLLIIIGLRDLLGISQPILAGPQFQNQGYAPEVYAFVAFMFWIITFSMSRASQRLETKLGVGTR